MHAKVPNQLARYIRKANKEEIFSPNARRSRDARRKMFIILRSSYKVIARRETTQMFEYDWLFDLLCENPVKLTSISLSERVLKNHRLH